MCVHTFVDWQEVQVSFQFNIYDILESMYAPLILQLCGKICDYIR